MDCSCYKFYRLSFIVPSLICLFCFSWSACSFYSSNPFFHTLSIRTMVLYCPVRAFILSILSEMQDLHAGTEQCSLLVTVNKQYRKKKEYDLRMNRTINSFV